MAAAILEREGWGVRQKEDEISVLTITLERVCGTAILGCHGPIAQNEETLLLCVAVGLQGQDVILDLSQATAIDRWGMGALVALQAAGIFLTLRNPHEQILTALRLRHLESIFKICESTRETVPPPDWHAGHEGLGDPSDCETAAYSPCAGLK